MYEGVCIVCGEFTREGYGRLGEFTYCAKHVHLSRNPNVIRVPNAIGEGVVRAVGEGASEHRGSSQRVSDNAVRRQRSIARVRELRVVRKRWTGPNEFDLDETGALIATVPPERWPWGPPRSHDGECELHASGLRCTCARSRGVRSIP